MGPSSSECSGTVAVRGREPRLDARLPRPPRLPERLPDREAFFGDAAALGPV